MPDVIPFEKGPDGSDLCEFIKSGSLTKWQMKF